MTEPTDPLDELASAHLDGLTTADEARRIDADPDLAARVEAMRAVREQLRADGAPIDDGRREAAIAAALAAFDDPELAEVTPLRRRHATRLRIVGAVAAVAMVALLIPAVTRLGDSDDDAVASKADATTEEDAGLERESSFGAGESAPGNASDQATTLEADAPLASTTTASAGAGIASLGTFPDDITLTVAVREALRAPPGDSIPANPAATSCRNAADQAAADAGAGIVLTALAVLADREVLVTVTEDAQAMRTLTVVDTQAGCAAVFETPL